MRDEYTSFFEYRNTFGKSWILSHCLFGGVGTIALGSAMVRKPLRWKTLLLTPFLYVAARFDRNVARRRRKKRLEALNEANPTVQSSSSEAAMPVFRRWDVITDALVPSGSFERFFPRLLRPQCRHQEMGRYH